MKHLSLILLVCFSLTLSVLPQVSQAKKEGFVLSSQTKHKAKNLKILSKAWSTALKAGSPSKRYYPETNSPVMDDTALYIGTHSGNFYALSTKTGKIKWLFENNDGIASTAGLSENQIFFSDFSGQIICLNKSTGALVWKKSFGAEMLAKPLVAGNKIYLMKGDNSIMALSQKNGRVVWKKRVNSYIKNLTMRGHANIIKEGNSLYVGLTDGHLYRLNASNGNTLWNKKLVIPLSSFKDIDAPVVVSGDSLYVGGYFGALYRIKKASGAIVWSTGLATGSPVLVLKDMVIATDTNGIAFGLDKKTGKQLWSNKLNGTVLSAPVLFKGMIYVTSFKRDSFLLAPETGQELQKLAVSKGSINKPLLQKSSLFVFTNDAKLIALHKRKK